MHYFLNSYKEHESHTTTRIIFLPYFFLPTYLFISNHICPLCSLKTNNYKGLKALRQAQK